MANYDTPKCGSTWRKRGVLAYMCICILPHCEEGNLLARNRFYKQKRVAMVDGGGFGNPITQEIMVKRLAVPASPRVAQLGRRETNIQTNSLTCIGKQRYEEG